MAELQGLAILAANVRNGSISAWLFRVGSGRFSVGIPPVKDDTQDDEQRSAAADEQQPAQYLVGFSKLLGVFIVDGHVVGVMRDGHYADKDDEKRAYDNPTARDASP